MKAKTFLNGIAFPLLAIAIFSWCGCYGPTLQLIDQPPVASPGDTVRIPIVVGQNGAPSAKAVLAGIPTIQDELAMFYSIYKNKETFMFPIFSVCIPEESELENPVSYWIDRDSVIVKGKLYHILAYDDWMTAYYPPDPGYRWWSCIGDCPVVAEDRDITLDPWLKLPSTEAEYFIDYFIGYEEDDLFDTIPENFMLDYRQSFDHYLTTAEPEHYTVTSVSTGGPGSLMQALDSIVNYGIITFNLDLPAMINFASAYIFKPFWLQGPSNGSLTINISDYINLENDGYSIAPVKISDLQFINWSGGSLGDHMLYFNWGGIPACLTLENIKFSDNISVSKDLISANGNLWLINCEFLNNETNYLINTIGQITRIENCTFTSNNLHSPSDISSNYTNLEICNTVFTDSVSPVNGYYTDVEMTNISFSGRDPLNFEDSRIEVTNSILWSSQLFQLALWNNNTMSSSCKIRNSNVRNWGILADSIIWLEGNISEDPLFLGEGDHWCNLQEGSPCIDAGTPDIAGLNLPPWDLLGNNRVWDGDGDGTAIVDMGAYEYGSIWVGEPEFNIQHSTFNINIYPNPVKTYLTIQYSLDQPSMVEIMIYNHLGQPVSDLYRGKEGPGEHMLKFDASSLPAGLYFVKIVAGQSHEVVKIVKL